MRPAWKKWSLIVGCSAMLVTGCDEEESAEAAAATTTEEAPNQPTANDEATAEASDLTSQARGNVEGEPFVTRGVLARRMPPPKIELRLFNREVSCESFDDDYELAEDEKVVSMILEWPKNAGETLAMRASNTTDFIKFCHGRDSGRASCNPRAQEQGTVTVVEANDQGGELSLDISSDQGALSGTVHFALCNR